MLLTIGFNSLLSSEFYYCRRLKHIELFVAILTKKHNYMKNKLAFGQDLERHIAVPFTQPGHVELPSLLTSKVPT